VWTGSQLPEEGSLKGWMGGNMLVMSFNSKETCGCYHYCPAVQA